MTEQREQLTQPPGERGQHHRHDQDVDRHHDDQLVRAARMHELERRPHEPGVCGAPGDTRPGADAMGEDDGRDVEVGDPVGTDLMAAGPGVAGGEQEHEGRQPPVQSPPPLDPLDQTHPGDLGFSSGSPHHAGGSVATIAGAAGSWPAFWPFVSRRSECS